MKFHLAETDGNIVRAFDGVAVTIGEDRYEQSIIVTPETLITDWQPPADIDALTAEHLQRVADLVNAGEVAILGAGAKQPPINPAWQAPFVQRQAVLEVMSLAAACRTYNIIAGDRRPVVAALILSGRP